MTDKKINSILKEVKRYFGFLFDASYRVRSAIYHPQAFGNWEIVLETNNSIIEICKDRTEILIYFVPLHGDRKYRIEFKSMIYFLSQGKQFVGPFEGNLFWGKKKQYEELAALLREYIDQITPYFGNDFDNYKNELLTAQRDHFMLAVKSLK